MDSLRADARRNRDRLIAAAAGLFAERGLDVSLEEIARQADVGTTTAYRRFPDKEDLIDAVFSRHLDHFVALSAAAVRDPDPWSALTGFLEAVIELQAANRGFQQLFHNYQGTPGIARRRIRISRTVAALVTRAKKAGQLRSDVAGSDLVMVLLMVGTVADRMRDVGPDVWRRYLALVLDGLRVRPEGVGCSRLTPRAPSAAQVDTAMHPPVPALRRTPPARVHEFLAPT
jgi:AcrR family transcriptional regulator